MQRAPPRLGYPFIPEFRAPSVGLFPIVEFDLPQVVLVAAAEMHQFTEDPLPDHIEYRQDIPPVIDIFQEHQVRPGFLMRIDQVPAFRERGGCRNFQPRIFTGLHRIDGHGGMPEPGGGDNDRIHRFQCKQVPIGVVVFAIGTRYLLPGLLYEFGAQVQAVRVDIAKGRYQDILAPQQVLQVVGPAQAHPDQSYPEHRGISSSCQQPGGG